MVLTEPVVVLVKANVANEAEFGDCPFSHRVVLTLAEKHIGYELKMINTSDKPAWFLEANPGGKVPVIKYEGKWVPDSDVITEILEKEKPEPSLITPEEYKAVGSTFFGAAAKYLKSKDPNDDTKANLLAEIKKLDDDLKKRPGAFIAGDKPLSVDFSLAPKIHALKVAGKKYKDFEIPADFGAVVKYVEALESLDSFKATKPSDEAIYAGWAKAVGV